MESSAGGDNLPVVTPAAGSVPPSCRTPAVLPLLSVCPPAGDAGSARRARGAPGPWRCCRAGGTAPLSSPDPQIPTSKACHGPCSFCWEGSTGRGKSQIPVPAPAPSASCLLPAVNKPLASSQQRWLRHTNTPLPFSSKINVVFIFIDLQGN